MSSSINKLDSILGPVAHSRAWTLTFGIGSAVLGLAVVFWPRETLRVAAVLFALQLIAASVFRFAVALMSAGDGLIHKLQLAALASFALVVGIVLLEDVDLSLRLMTIVLGAYWAIHGGVELVEAISYSGGTDRTWVIGSGIMGVVVGLILIAVGAFPVDDPALQSRFLLVTRIIGVWLVMFGVILAVRAFRDHAPAQVRPLASH
jgi:uncharacterized membrane protein HdeD (DUF308 family)